MDRAGKARLKAMGLSYRAYLRSPHWRAFRASYWSTHARRCLACTGTDLTLHHVTYIRLGAERPDDVVPLCLSCHRALHNLQKRKRHRYLTPESIRAALRPARAEHPGDVARPAITTANVGNLPRCADESRAP